MIVGCVNERQSFIYDKIYLYNDANHLIYSSALALLCFISKLGSQIQATLSAFLITQIQGTCGRCMAFIGKCRNYPVNTLNIRRLYRKSNLLYFIKFINQAILSSCQEAESTSTSVSPSISIASTL